MAPTVSVIVPVYNTRAYLAECLESVCQQSLADIEVIVVDDSSPDGSSAIIEDVCAHDPRVRCIRHDTNRGLPASRNTGLRAACGRYVYHVDSDDLLAPGALATLVRAADDDQAEIVMGHAAHLYEAGIVGRNIARCKRLRRSIAYSDEPALWYGGGVVFFLMLRAFVVHNGLYFDERISYGEDQVYLAMTLPKAQRITLLPEVVYYYRQREDGLSAVGDWPESRWRDVGRWLRLAAEQRAEYKPALTYFLAKDWEWRAAMLVLAKKRLPKTVFRDVLEDFGAACRLLDCDAGSEAMPAGYMMPRVPHTLRALVQHLQAGEWRLAEADLDRISRTVLDERIFRVWDMSRQRRWPELRDEAEAGCKVVPTSALYWYFHGLALEQIGRTGDALTAYEEAIVHDGAFVKPVENLARLYMRDGRIDDAMALIQEAQDRGVTSARLHTLMGKSLVTAGRPGEAEMAFRAAIEEDVNSFAAHVDLCSALRRVNRYDDALAIAKDIVQQFPTEPRSHQLLGQLSARNGDLAAAERGFLCAIELGDRSAATLAQLGRVFERTGRLEQAIETLREAIAAAPEDSRAKEQLGSLLSASYAYDEAVDILTQATRMSQDRPGPDEKLIKALIAKGDHEAALTTARSATERFPRSANIALLRARVARKRGHLGEAVAFFRRSVTLNPNNASAHRLLLQVLIKTGDVAEAAALAATVCEQFPDVRERDAALADLIEQIAPVEREAAPFGTVQGDR